jgi:hypothetical protein
MTTACMCVHTNTGVEILRRSAATNRVLLPARHEQRRCRVERLIQGSLQQERHGAGGVVHQVHQQCAGLHQGIQACHHRQVRSCLCFAYLSCCVVVCGTYVFYVIACVYVCVKG